MKQVIFAAFFTLFLLVCANSAFACLCALRSNKEHIKIMKKQADAIFTGTVKAVSREPSLAYKVTFAVQKSWKSKDIKEYTIYTSGGCNVWFEEGKSYLVYAVREGTGQLITDVCMGTGILLLTQKQVKLLGKPVFINTIE